MWALCRGTFPSCPSCKEHWWSTALTLLYRLHAESISLPLLKGQALLLSSLLHIPCTLLRSTASGVSPDSQPAHTPGDPSHLTCLIFITPRLTAKIYKEISLAELIFTPQQLQCQQRDTSPCLPPTPTPPELECPPPPWPADSPCPML